MVGWEEATKQAMHDAYRALDNVEGITVMNKTVRIEEGDTTRRRVDVRVIFEVDG